MMRGGVGTWVVLMKKGGVMREGVADKGRTEYTNVFKKCTVEWI